MEAERFGLRVGSVVVLAIVTLFAAVEAETADGFVTAGDLVVTALLAALLVRAADLVVHLGDFRRSREVDSGESGGQ